MLEAFADMMKQTARVVRNMTNVNPSTRQLAKVWTVDQSSARSGVVWSKALAEKYMGAGAWNSDVKLVLCTTPDFLVTNSDRVQVDGETIYAVDGVDDVGGQGEVLLVGLVGVK